MWKGFPHTFVHIMYKFHYIVKFRALTYNSSFCSRTRILPPPTYFSCSSNNTTNTKNSNIKIIAVRAAAVCLICWTSETRLSQGPRWRLQLACFVRPTVQNPKIFNKQWYEMEERSKYLRLRSFCSVFCVIKHLNNHVGQNSFSTMSINQSTAWSWMRM